MAGRIYEVVSPLEWRTVPILDDGTGPSEPHADFRYVRTTTKRRARALFVRAMRRHYARRTRPGWLTEGNPYASLFVREVRYAF